MTGQQKHDTQAGYHSLSRIVFALALSTVMVLSTVALVPTAAAQEDPQTFTVEQGEKCVQISPLGDGTQSVADFYDYRSAVTEPQGLYSSYGTRNIQLNQVSQLFAYDGANGTSLVFLHDKLGAEEGGFVATADVSGLPTDGTWAVRDDYYGDRQDDIYRTNLSGGQQTHIEWLSNHNRTDGAAFRGIGSSNYDAITVDIKFNSRSDNYPFIKWRGPPEQNKIEQWVTRSATGETTALNLNQSVQISPGTCSGGTTDSGNGGSKSGSSGSNSQSNELFGNNSSNEFTVTETQTPAGLFSNSSSDQVQTTSPTPTSSTPTATATATPTETPTATDSPTTQPSTEPDIFTTSGNGSVGELSGNSTETNSNSGGSSGFGPGFGVGLALVAILVLGLLGLVRRSQ